MENTALLKTIVEWAEEMSYEDIPEPVLEVAKTALIDYFGVTVAGSATEVAKNVQRYVQEKNVSGACSITGTDERSSVSYAALANGTASHALDYDDVSWSTIGHPTVTIAPVVFAVTEQMGCSGKEMLLAYVVAVEAQHQIARWLMPELSEQGWHTTPTIGIFGAVIAAGILMKLSGDTLLNALSIAASMSSGTRGNFGSQVKPLHAGLAAFNGITAIELAQLGIAGKSDVLEASDGYFACFSPQSKQPREIVLGLTWDLLNPGLVFKQYPCCSGSHAAIDCMKELKSQHNLDVSSIEEISVGVSLLGPRELVCNCPTNAIEAKFSMQYALASVLVHGEVTLKQFTDEAVQDPLIQETMKKINMHIDSELAKLGFIGTAPVRLKIYTKTNEVISGENNLAKGNPEKPLSSEEIVGKFFQCTKGIIGKEKASTILEKLQALEDIKKPLFY